jgi:hypothetical protein
METGRKLDDESNIGMISLTNKSLKIVLPICMLFLTLACRERNIQDMIFFDFETALELDRIQWSCHTLSELTDRHVSHGARSLKVDMYPSNYPGVTLDLDVHDWRSYKVLQFNVFNPQSEDVMLSVRIDDKKEYPSDGDSYKKKYSLTPGLTMIQIPIEGLRTNQSERMIDIKNIHRIILYTVNPAMRTTLYYDFMRLITVM